MISSKLSHMFWVGAVALSVCVPVAQSQEPTGTGNVPAIEITNASTVPGFNFDAAQKGAEAGNAEDQLRLAWAYTNRAGVTRNPEKASA